MHTTSFPGRHAQRFALLALALACPAGAHDTWLLPDRFALPEPAVLSFELTSGMAFPALEAAISPERIEAAACRLGGQGLAIGGFTTHPASLGLSLRLPAAGLATCWVELGPKVVELTPAQVQGYLEELDAPEALRQAWATGGTASRWRERYTKHAKTFITVGAAAGDGSWGTPVGMRLELLPETDPGRLEPGAAFPLSVLKQGAPLAGFGVGAVHESGHVLPVSRTDSSGRVTIRLDRPGRWLLRGTELIESTAEGLEWESHFTTLTVRVGPP
jgi:hypothetical protein